MGSQVYGQRPAVRRSQRSKLRFILEFLRQGRSPVQELLPLPAIALQVPLLSPFEGRQPALSQSLAPTSGKVSKGERQVSAILEAAPVFSREGKRLVAHRDT